MIYSVFDARYRRIVSPWGFEGAVTARQVAQKQMGWA